MNTVKEIELPFWQNPQCYVFVQFHRDETIIYFDIWNKPAESITSQLGAIIFHDCFQVSTRKGVKKYFPDEILFHSSIFEISNSIELSEYLLNFKKYNYCDVTKNLRHFIVNSHDSQISIFASNYEFILKNKSSENMHIFRNFFD